MKAVSRESVSPTITGVEDGNWFRISKYFGNMNDDVSSEPVGFLAETGPDSPDDRDRYQVVAPHFHLVRQFQVFIDGDRPQLGKRDLGAFDFHYVDASTPYGPFISGKEGISYFTLRPRQAPRGVFWMPGSRDKMTRRAGRNVVVPLSQTEAASGLETMIDAHDDGLAAFRITVGAGEALPEVDPAGSGGQYHVVMRGSVVHDGEEFRRLSLIWVDPEDEPAALTAGPEGAAVLVLQFPVVDVGAELVVPGAQVFSAD
jgi:hypothetical protein